VPVLSAILIKLPFIGAQHQNRESRYSSCSVREARMHQVERVLKESEGKPYSPYSNFFSFCGSVAYKVVCPHTMQVNACNGTVEKSVRTRFTPSLQGAITRSPPHSGQGVRGGNRVSLSILLSLFTCNHRKGLFQKRTGDFQGLQAIFSSRTVIWLIIAQPALRPGRHG
jgi:hypothetical protein